MKKPAFGRDAPTCQWRNGPYDCESLSEWLDRLESWSKIPAKEPEQETEVERLRAFHKAAGPLMERERERRDTVKSYHSGSYGYGGYPDGSKRNLSEAKIDAAIAAFDAVEGGGQ